MQSPTTDVKFLYFYILLVAKSGTKHNKLACEDVSADGVLKFAKGRKQDFNSLLEACVVKPEELTELIKTIKVF